MTAAGGMATDPEEVDRMDHATPSLRPFERLLEALHEAIAAGDAGREADLRERIEADLAARESAWELSS